MNQLSGKPWLWPAFVITLLVVTMAGSLSVLWIANMDGGVQLTPSYVNNSAGTDVRQNPAWILTDLMMNTDEGNTRISTRVTSQNGSAVAGLSVTIESFENQPAPTSVPILLTEDPEQTGLYTAVVRGMTLRETSVTILLASESDTLRTQKRLVVQN